MATRATPRQTCTTIVTWATPVAHHRAGVRSRAPRSPGSRSSKWTARAQSPTTAFVTTTTHAKSACAWRRVTGAEPSVPLRHDASRSAAMAAMADLVVQNAQLVDGSGGPSRMADIVVDGGRIAEVAEAGAASTATATQVLDADGRLVTPGWVDVHTHYDAQVTWDPWLTPSSWHGVTTAVMGNCGVGFAPAHPSRRDWLIELMEGVEDIPGAAMAEGIVWEWEHFGEF